MAVTVIMPKIGISVETCLIGEWKKKAGDKVAAGEALFTYETDKAALECESTAEGTLLEIFYGNGEEVPVLSPVCAIGNPGEDVSGLRGAAGSAGAAGATGAAQPEPAAAAIAAQPEPAAAAASDGASASVPQGETLNLAVSPRALNLANRLGIDYRGATPSGPHGRVIERDIEALSVARAKAAPPEAEAAAPAAAAAAPAQAAGLAPAPAPTTAVPTAPAAAATDGYTDAKLPQIRRVIGDAMKRSLSETAQLTHHHSFDATGILALRAEFKRNGEKYGVGGVSIGDIILFAVSRVLLKHPDLNAHLLDGYTLRRFAGVHLGVAIDTDRGLLVPTVFDADKKSLREISDEVKGLAKAARSGSINPDSLRGGTFTVSNLGMTGVEVFTPIINPPQVAIIGVCGITQRVRAAQPGGGVEAYPSIGISLTYDHRAVDGAPASRFAQSVCDGLENISMLLSV